MENKKKPAIRFKGYIATGEENVPDLVGLCEVENDHCLKDLKIGRASCRERV